MKLKFGILLSLISITATQAVDMLWTIYNNTSSSASIEYDFIGLPNKTITVDPGALAKPDYPGYILRSITASVSGFSNLTETKDSFEDAWSCSDDPGSDYGYIFILNDCNGALEFNPYQGDLAKGIDPLAYCGCPCGEKTCGENAVVQGKTASDTEEGMNNRAIEQTSRIKPIIVEKPIIR